MRHFAVVVTYTNQFNLLVDDRTGVYLKINLATELH